MYIKDNIKELIFNFIIISINIYSKDRCSKRVKKLFTKIVMGITICNSKQIKRTEATNKIIFIIDDYLN